MSKRIGVTFSSGFFGFFAHGGFLAATRELGLEPVAYSGASSGAILAAMAACDMPEHEIQNTLFNLKKEDFWDPEPLSKLIIATLRLFRGYAGYLTGYKFEQLLRRLLPVARIEQCVHPLAVVATNLTHMRAEVFTEGDLVKAIAASGAVPGLFKPVRYHTCLYVDGGIVNKAPVEALANLTKIDSIVVHFMDSESFGSTIQGSLAKRFSPWHIHRNAVDIGRYEAYKLQCNLLEAKGIELIEVKTQTPVLGPDKLHLGPLAYRTAKDATLRCLSELL